MLLILSFAFAYCLGGCNSNAASVGIIGGADGPTAVMVSSNLDWLHICGFIGLTLAIILLIFFICRRCKKK